MMSTPAWTPGPWQQHDNAPPYGKDYAATVWGPEGLGHGLVADCRHHAPWPTDIPNARLIAAAPELYSRLEWLTQQVIDLGWTCTEELATLAKARGETP